MVDTFNLSTRRVEQMNIYDFEASLIYIHSEFKESQSFLVRSLKQIDRQTKSVVEGVRE